MNSMTPRKRKNLYGKTYMAYCHVVKWKKRKLQIIIEYDSIYVNILLMMIICSTDEIAWLRHSPTALGLRRKREDSEEKKITKG